MTTIEQLIGDLLLRHNCVIIPSFGGFVARNVSAKVDFTKGLMLPPGKSLLFNRQLINNDGLLLNELAQNNKISFDQANELVRSKVNSWNEVLKTGGRIELDRIGLLYLDAEKNVCFEQDRFFNMLLEAYGLVKIQFLTEEDVKIVENKPITEDSEKIVIPFSLIKGEKGITIDSNTPKEDTTIEHPVFKKQRISAWRYIAAACLLPVAFYTIWIPVKTDVLESGMISVHDFNPFHEYSKAKYNPTTKPFKITEKQRIDNSLQENIETLPSDVNSYTFKYDEDCYINVKLSSNSDAKEKFNSAEQNKTVVQVNSLQYIVGCFNDKTNAENLVDQLNRKGFDARIYDIKNGLHRITAGSALSEEAMTDIVAKANAMSINGWILK